MVNLEKETGKMRDLFNFGEVILEEMVNGNTTRQGELQFHVICEFILNNEQSGH